MEATPENPRDRTRLKILAGAADAVARHGLAKLDMGDVSASAGVSRGTVYRYFEGRDALLDALAIHEALQFWKGCLDALGEASDERRVEILVLQATRQVHEHAALRRILETDPGLVLSALRAQFPRIRGQLGRLLAQQLRASSWVGEGVVREEELADWITRLMISAFLIPPKAPDALARGLGAVLRPEARR